MEEHTKHAAMLGAIAALMLHSFSAFAAASTSAASASASPWIITQNITAPADNVLNADRIALGQLLFFDPRLSGKGTISCASCHNPALGWADGLPRAVGFDMKPLARATPTLVNVGLNKLQMWDGRKPTLEEQALGPLLAADEQNMPPERLEATLQGIPGYAPLFARAYPNEGITAATFARAVASFERTLISGDSPFDRWQQGDAQAVDDSAKRGFELFVGKAKCSLCHQQPNFNDDGFHNIGLATNGEPLDMGRFAHRKVAVLRGAFKTPTLRDIELTAPYMHNGLYQTLEQVVDHYDRGADVKDNLDRNIFPLDLNPQEKADVVAFMKTLTGKRQPMQLPQLPR